MLETTAYRAAASTIVKRGSMSTGTAARRSRIFCTGGRMTARRRDQLLRLRRVALGLDGQDLARERLDAGPHLRAVDREGPVGPHREGARVEQAS